MHVYMYMHTYALCGYTRHLRTCRYAAMQVNRPSGISQAVAIAVNRTQGVNRTYSQVLHSEHYQTGDDMKFIYNKINWISLKLMWIHVHTARVVSYELKNNILHIDKGFHNKLVKYLYL